MQRCRAANETMHRILRGRYHAPMSATNSFDTVRFWRPSLGEPNTLLADAVCIRYRADATDPWTFPTPWLAGSFDAETWHLPSPVEAGQFGRWSYRHAPGIAMAALHAAEAGDEDPSAPVAAVGRDAYRELFRLQKQLGLAHVVRIWHWLSAPTAGEGETERYRQFCRGRAEALDNAIPAWPNLPPATLVAGSVPGLRMHVILSDSPVEPVENPRQISAYRYPPRYGQRAPAFARGGRVQLAGHQYLMISGTASIVGHESLHAGDLAAQFDEAFCNITAVIDTACNGKASPADLECIKVYLHNPESAEAVLVLLSQRLPHVPAVLVHAPLCRHELLLELEGQMRLDHRNN